MFPIVLLLGFSLRLGLVTRPEDAALHRVREAVLHLDDKKSSFVHFERTLKPSEVTTWQRLLQRVPAYSENYAALSFALAYYGVDYDQNIRRLLRPYRMWQGDVKRWGKEYFDLQPRESIIDRDSLVDLDFVWFSMNLLYLKHHDLKSLRTWLDVELDGHWAEGCDESLGDLWKRHERDMLRAAAGSPDRLSHLAEALAFSYFPENTDAERIAYRSMIAELRHRTHDRQPQVALAARRLVPELQAWRHRSRREGLTSYL